MNKDEEHLRLLSIFHTVVAALTGLFSLLPIIHLVMGIIFLTAPEKFQGSGPPPPPFVGWMLIIIASGIILLGLAMAVCIFLSGRFLSKRRHYMFCLVMGGIECLVMPFGTVLGVFTIIVLSRPTVKPLFTGPPPIRA